MITFIETEARNVRPGALVLIDYGNTRIARAVRDVEERASSVELTFADGDGRRMVYSNGAKLWAAQRAI